MRVPAALLLIAVAGCHRDAAPSRTRLDTLDERLTQNQVVEDAGHAPRGTGMDVRRTAPPGSPDWTHPTASPAPAPATQAATRDEAAGGGACAGSVRYSLNWAARLPGDLGVYPGARVVEAAGNDSAGCALRIVSFASADARDRVARWYAAKGEAVGYHVMQRRAPTRYTITGERDDRAFVLYLEPGRGGGTDADLIVDGGR